MNTFSAALSQVYTADLNITTPATTANGAATLATSSNALVDLFFVIGSSRKQDISHKFLSALSVDPQLTMKMLFWARDVRGGAGERDTFRRLIKLLATSNQSLARSVVDLVPEYGRWDDLECVMGTPLEQDALRVWASAIHRGEALACKWAPRKGPLANSLRKKMGVATPKEYRQLVVNNGRSVEQHMCARQWHNIHYDHVPSVASARYQKAFSKNDPRRYSDWRQGLQTGATRVNAGAVYPYDVVKSANQGDPQVAVAQWNALPNYLTDDASILPLVDTSSSMHTPVGGNKNLTCMDVAVSLGLYIADRQKGAFSNMFLNFDSRSRIHNLEGDLLSKLTSLRGCQWGGSTNIESAFREILRVAVLGNVLPKDMPRYLLVLTDMGFDPRFQVAEQTAFDMAREIYARHGYALPTIVWWNLSHRPGGYGGDSNTPVTAHENGTALISGFSPSIMKSVLASGTVSPYDIMLEAINRPRYDPVGNAMQGTVSQ